MARTCDKSRKIKINHTLSYLLIVYLSKNKQLTKQKKTSTLEVEVFGIHGISNYLSVSKPNVLF